MIHRPKCGTTQTRRKATETRRTASYPWAAGKVVKILGRGLLAMFRRVSDTLLGALGWRPLLIHGDPCVLDRWLWLRGRLRPGNVRTFDAGCGNGGFSIYAARAGNEVVAASFSPEEQRAASRRAGELGVTGIDFRTLDLRELEHFRDSLGSFDQIICFETVEHLLDDAALVSRLAALLRPAGRLLLTAPFAGHHPLYTEERNPSAREDGSHVRYGYSQERLRQLAQGAGLRVLDEGFVSGVVSQKLTDLLRRLSERIGRPAAWAIVAAPARARDPRRVADQDAALSVSERGAMRRQARIRRAGVGQPRCASSSQCLGGGVWAAPRRCCRVCSTVRARRDTSSSWSSSSMARGRRSSPQAGFRVEVIEAGRLREAHRWLATVLRLTRLFRAPASRT